MLPTILMNHYTRHMIKSFLKAALPSPVLNAARYAVRGAKNLRSPKKVFQEIYRHNAWGDGHSASGPGSNLVAAKYIRRALPDLIQRHSFKSILDIPCGDLYWIKDVLPPGISYCGADIVPEIIEVNRKSYSGLGRFEVLDLTSDALPGADLALVRDCLIHLPCVTGVKALNNIAAAGIPFVLTTTYVDVTNNIDIEIGGFRPVNLMLPPYNLPSPMELVSEVDFPGQHHGKSMGLWRTSDFRFV